MKNIYYYVIILLTYLIQPTKGQNLLYVHEVGAKNLYLVNLDDCSSSKIGEMPDYMYDIAMSPDGKLYAVSRSGKLYYINKNNATGTVVEKLSSFYPNALVYGADNFLYAADDRGNILKIDPKTGSTINLGNCGFSSGGDLTFYEGALYLSDNKRQLIRIDLNQPAQSKLVGKMTPPNILGLITVGTIDCQGTKPKVYATSGNQLFEVDMVTAATTLVCKLDSYISIGGAASEAEAFKFNRRHAGQDSTIKVCYGMNKPINLTQYLRDGEPGGTWKDLDKSNSLNLETLITSKLTSGTYRFQYIVGENLCADTSVVTIRVLEKIEVDRINLKNPTCTADDGEIQIIMKQVYGTLTFSLNSSSFQKENKFEKLKSGTHSITIQSSDGCKIDSTLLLNTPNIPQVKNIKVQLATCKNTGGIIEIVSNENEGPLTYSINGVDFQSQSTFKDLTSKIYTVTIKNLNNCQFSTKVEVAQETSPIINDITIKQPVCGNSNGALTILSKGGKGALTYSINGSTFQLSNEFKSLAAGDYSVVVIDQNQCTVTQEILLKKSESPIISELLISHTTCGKNNGQITIVGLGKSEPLQYSLDSINFQASNSFQNLKASNYTGYIQDAIGCVTAQRTQIAESFAPEIKNVESKSAICGMATGSLLIKVTESENIEYTLDGKHYQKVPLFDQLPAGDYEVGVKSNLNCEVKQVARVEDSCSEVIYRPDSFTPNGDGNNDHWAIFFPFSSIEIEKIQIFSRDGEVIFHQVGLNVKSGEGFWDGTYRGVNVIPGVYAYTLNVKLVTGKRHALRGIIAVIR